MWAILSEEWNWCFETDRPDGETGVGVYGKHEWSEEK